MTPDRPLSDRLQDLALTLLVVGPIALLVRGFVLTKMWRWLLVPPFGLPELPLSAALGGSLVMALLTHRVPTAEEQETPAVLQGLLSVLSSLIGLGFAWVVKTVAY